MGDAETKTNHYAGRMQTESAKSDLIRGADAAILRRARTCRWAAGVALALGLLGAGLVYWLEPPPPDYSDNPEMVGFNRAADHQMSQMYGRQGQVIEAFDEALQHPGTQAILILVAAVGVAAGCFHFARILEWEAQPPPDDSGSL